MSASHSPIICVACHREFPEDLKAEDSPRYFAQCGLLPRMDKAFDFATEVQRLCGYLKALSDGLGFGDHKEVKQDTYDTIFQLVGELREEALRRVELTLEAARVVADREYKAERAAKQAGPTPDTGRC